ncbi:MAG TPA: hypothetical protein VJY34_16440, partial [Roseiarcus sp.]|nr:hypothetical protein [Roseiarcus sp.]
MSAGIRSVFLREASPSLYLDAYLGAHVLEHDADGVNDFFVLVGLAVLDDKVLRLAAFPVIEVMLVGEAVVPAAVPERAGSLRRASRSSVAGRIGIVAAGRRRPVIGIGV